MRKVILIIALIFFRCGTTSKPPQEEEVIHISIDSNEGKWDNFIQINTTLFVLPEDFNSGAMDGTYVKENWDTLTHYIDSIERADSLKMKVL